ncbi:hypothetical protein GSI_05521 [Ganoderma sinense ZZ0214-1]|uniref:Uncharacterized protein n=1 Tax=Ganoderma sinense ZZ0214-1 TaxID=1077348 RepID=A0A2G8SET2_9APHY|nr:hypothetical protein GSI_05521 [Ganoderma sinense ZZ0214-1]
MVIDQASPDTPPGHLVRPDINISPSAFRANANDLVPGLQTTAQETTNPSIHTGPSNVPVKTGAYVVPFKTAHLRQQQIVNKPTRFKTGTSDSAQGIPEVVGIAGASGHGMDKAVAGRDVGGQEMKQVSESPQRSSQFISSLMVLPYLFPAYGLLQLATSLEVGSSLPEWYQLIRAAVVVTAKVEDLRHARERQRPTQEFNPLAYHGGREPWVMLWLRLQPTQRRRPVALQKHMEPKDCLHYPNNTSAADWREFWPRTRETIFTVMLELRACSPFNHQDQAIAETMDSRRWSSWVVDVLWVFSSAPSHTPVRGGCDHDLDQASSRTSGTGDVDSSPPVSGGGAIGSIDCRSRIGYLRPNTSSHEQVDCLHYPNNTSAADWREFWPRTRETIFTVMLELRACSPFNHQDQAIAETMDSRRWSSWVVDVLWVFRQLLRIGGCDHDLDQASSRTSGTGDVDSSPPVSGGGAIGSIDCRSRIGYLRPNTSTHEQFQKANYAT